MKLAERSYSTKSVRPRPLIYAEPDGSLLVITTSWGEPALAERVNEDIAKYVQAANADVEVTSPFEFMTSLSDEANHLRVATLISNESLYRGDNRVEYLSGFETLVLYQKENKIAFAQVGAPHLLIHREGLGLAPISVSYESSHEFGSVGEILPPIPQQLAGVDASLNLRCGDFRVERSDHLLLYAGAFWPDTLWRPTMAGVDLNQFAQRIVQKIPDSPFWIGLVQLNN